MYSIVQMEEGRRRKKMLHIYMKVWQKLRGHCHSHHYYAQHSGGWRDRGPENRVIPTVLVSIPVQSVIYTAVPDLPTVPAFAQTIPTNCFAELVFAGILVRTSILSRGLQRSTDRSQGSGGLCPPNHYKYEPSPSSSRQPSRASHHH